MESNGDDELTGTGENMRSEPSPSGSSGSSGSAGFPGGSSRFVFRAIGWVGSPFSEPVGVPIQPAFSGARAVVRLLPEYREALEGLEGFSHIILIYVFHRAGPYRPRVRPFLDGEARGLLATRAPARPNPIGLSIVKLEKVEGTRLHISGCDILDGTPILDVKPYVPAFDSPEHRGEKVRTGWLQGKTDRGKTARDDRRFTATGKEENRMTEGKASNTLGSRRQSDIKLKNMKPECPESGLAPPCYNPLPFVMFPFLGG